jgi:hypothetical protein
MVTSGCYSHKGLEVGAIDPFDFAANELQALAGERQKT